MASRIEDYAVIADYQSIAPVAKDGSPDCGRWKIAPDGEARALRRRYRPGTLILETEFETPEGAVTLIDLMPIFGQGTDVVRIVAGQRGRVPIRMELLVRFGYGAIVPWVRAIEGGIEAVAGPEVLRLITPVVTHGEGLSTVAQFPVSAGERVPFVLTWSPSHLPDPGHVDAEQALTGTEAGWRAWSDQCTVTGPYREIVQRSLITLKALTYQPTGGIVAAATTSLPERPGGMRNWDYRICWLRDATFTLYSLMSAGYFDEARDWTQWLLRAVAGDPSQLQILYGIAGERRLPELELDWLPGYEGSRPRRVGLAPSEAGWSLQRALMGYLEKIWQVPDEGIWEVRGPRRHFTHSKVMAWVAFDRAVKGVEQFGLEGPLEHWRSVRDRIHESVCREGFDAGVGAFVQSYGSKELDSSLLMLPLVGFLPATDPRALGTVRAIESSLLRDGFIARYATHPAVDGLPPGEGAFLPCSFWLADNYVGLLSEEYDPVTRRLLGNFPQAFTHVSLNNTALNLTGPRGPAEQRKED